MVEWKTLNKIVKSISTGLNPRQNFILNEEDATLYYVTVKEITTNKVVFSDSTDRITKKAKQIINNRSKLSEGDILFSGIGTIGKVAYVNIPTNNWDCSESVFLIKPNELEVKGKYLAYILSSEIAKNQYEKGAAGAIMKGVRKATLESLLIPIPSLSEQTRIVGILDTFTASIDNLKEQIAERRKQYEHYRDQLLDLEEKEGVEMKTLGECVALITDGDHQPPPKSEEGIPFITISNIEKSSHKIDFTNSFYVPKEYYNSLKGDKKPRRGDVLYTVTGSFGIPVLIQNDNIAFCFQRHIALIRPNNTIATSQYIYHWLRTAFAIKQGEEKASGGAQKTVSLNSLRGFRFYYPPLSEQSRIVSILDTFEASIQNLESQLKQREKQYEYYRNKLLTFE